MALLIGTATTAGAIPITVPATLNPAVRKKLLCVVGRNVYRQRYPSGYEELAQVAYKIS